ncbi:MAG: hypothetical protein A3F90_08065 [Deltaproteobacteria bacterium RIFCSPLOWO2_12_FULL_60_19]|nr:MAG: hypothetical protein A3F90_08065 [Deltaproteobacteria bacterium RIFCSPLOWO2_12_FULL_60_19]
MLPLILAFPLGSFAQTIPATGAAPVSPEKKEETKAGQTKRPKVSRTEGQLLAVDTKAGTLRVKIKDVERSFTVEGRGAKARLEKTRVGQPIRVYYYEKEGKFIATSLRGGLGGHEPPKVP